MFIIHLHCGQLIAENERVLFWIVDALSNQNEEFRVFRFGLLMPDYFERPPIKGWVREFTMPSLKRKLEMAELCGKSVNDLVLTDVEREAIQ